MKILLLGNDYLLKFLINNHDVINLTKKIVLDDIKNFDFIISYGYKYIIKKDIIKYFHRKIINLHISYLPYNRGADPNLWSILDNTPSGVTIHYIDETLDTGDILCQKKVILDYENDTLESSYNKLTSEIINLFIQNFDKICNGEIRNTKQNNTISTIHFLKDRPDNIMPYGWKTKISNVRKLYKDIYNNYTNKMKINNTLIGENYPTYIIAELSCNHNQDKSVALRLIEEAHKCGANAIKLQTYTPDTITLKCDNPEFKECLNGSIWEGQTLYDLYSKAYTPWEWHKELKEYANSLGMDLFSSPFDTTAVDFLETIDAPAYKIASFEITDHVLIKKIAQTGKPVIISSGMASKGELEEAVNLLRQNCTTQICMLKCTSAYPSKPEDANLLTIKNMKESFNVIGGLSDHTLGIEVPIASVCLGARVIEKHFTLSRDSGSPDDAFSLTPSEFKQMVDSVRIVEKTIGVVKYGGVKKEQSSKNYRRSLFVTKNIKKGEIFTSDNIRSIRPSHGLHTKYYEDILGKTAREDIEFGTPLSWKLID
jgi:pseudaminic acid synthase